MREAMSIQDSRPARGSLVIGVDGGNSKTHLVLATASGTVLAAVAGPTASHPVVGIDRTVEILHALALEAARRAGHEPADGPIADAAAVCMAGADTPAEVRLLTRRLAAAGIASRLTVHNDVAAVLRAGALRGWGVAVVCGAGVNALARAPDGRTAGYIALGEASGDWGGGAAVGLAALAAAVRGRDGRGTRTVLERSVPAALGLRRPLDVALAIHRGTLARAALIDLVPAVFAAARGGDHAATRIVDRQAHELALMTLALLRRLRLVRREVDVVLAGGVLTAREPRLLDGFTHELRAVAAHARVSVLGPPPVLGAALLAMASDDPAAETRIRTQVITPK